MFYSTNVGLQIHFIAASTHVSLHLTRKDNNLLICVGEIQTLQKLDLIKIKSIKLKAVT